MSVDNGRGTNCSVGKSWIKSEKCVIWKRYINKLKLEKRNFLETYYMQRYVQVMFQNFMLLEWGIDFGLVTPPVSEQEAQRGQTWCSHILWLAAVSDQVFQLLAHSRWFSPGTPASSSTKTGRHNIFIILHSVKSPFCYFFQ